MYSHFMWAQASDKSVWTLGIMTQRPYDTVIFHVGILAVPSRVWDKPRNKNERYCLSFRHMWLTVPLQADFNQNARAGTEEYQKHKQNTEMNKEDSMISTRGVWKDLGWLAKLCSGIRLDIRQAFCCMLDQISNTQFSILVLLVQ